MGQKPLNFSVIDKAYKKILEHDIRVDLNEPMPLEINRSVTRCGLGAGSASISYEGLLFGCQEQDSRDTNDYFYIGDIFNGVNVKRHSQLLKDYFQPILLECSNKARCQNCMMRSICVNDLCPSVSNDLYNKFFIRPEIDCIFHEYLFKKCIQEMKILVEGTKNELFKEYLDNLFNKERSN